MKSNIIMISALLALSLMSCSSDDHVTDTAKDWDNTSAYFESTDNSGYSTFYKPSVGYVGDPMPFYDPVAGNFKIMYLQEFRPNSATYHPFWCLETEDGATYRSLGEVIPTGTQSEMDGALGTGSVIYDDATKMYHTFYTAHSVNKALTGMNEAIMVATSTDCLNWTKDRSFMLTAGAEYSSDDFRDPCVIKGEDGHFHLLVSTVKGGKGVIAEYTSDNLRDWNSVGVFMPMMWDRFYECPDLFKMGDWWYLVYSEKHAAVRRVQYFKGRTLEELKSCTANDAGIWPDSHEGMLDSRAFYAGKTAGNGNERYMWGWCPTRAGEDNLNVGAYPAEPEWAGALVAHKLVQHSDGTLSLTAVDGIKNKFSTPYTLSKMGGEATEANGGYSLAAGQHVLFNRLKNTNRLEFTVTPADKNGRFGISFVRGSDSDTYYTVVVNSEGDGRRKINLEQEGPAGVGFIAGADGYLFDAPADGVYNITILSDNSVCTVYINDNVAYTARLYGMHKNCWSVNSYDSPLALSNIKVYTE